MFRFAIFDMDGLMFDTERLYIQAFREIVSVRTGMDFPVDKLKSLIGMNRADGAVLFPQLFGTKYTPAECYAIANEWRAAYYAEHGMPIKPGLIELLDWLTARGVRLAVATSSNREVAVRNTTMTGVYNRFELIMGGDMVVHGKPDPELFNLTAQTLGCIDHAECVVFEDSRNGMLAAAAGGFPVIIVPDQIDPTPGNEDKIFAKVKTLSDAIQILEPYC